MIASVKYGVSESEVLQVVVYLRVNASADSLSIFCNVYKTIVEVAHLSSLGISSFGLISILVPQLSLSLSLVYFLPLYGRHRTNCIGFCEC